jgi:hypothetical protein
MDGQRWFSWSMFRWWLRCSAGLRPCSRLVARADDGGARWRRYLLEGVVEAVVCSSAWEYSGGNLRSCVGRARVASRVTHSLGPRFWSRHQLEGPVEAGGCRRWSSVDAGAAASGTMVGNSFSERVAYMVWVTILCRQCGEVVGSVDSSLRRWFDF